MHCSLIYSTAKTICCIRMKDINIHRKIILLRGGMFQLLVGFRTFPVLIAWYNGTNSFDSSNGEYKYTKVQGCFYEVAYMLFQSMFSYVKSCSKKLITVASQRVLLWPIDCCI